MRVNSIEKQLGHHLVEASPAQVVGGDEEIECAAIVEPQAPPVFFLHAQEGNHIGIPLFNFIVGENTL